LTTATWTRGAEEYKAIHDQVFYISSLSDPNVKLMCKDCSEYKHCSEFYKQATVKRGFMYVCKDCHKQSQKLLKSIQRYGINNNEYNVLLERQGGVCAICETPPTEEKLFVDHSHSSNEVRGLLCRTCNTGLGLLGDDLASLEKAINYLKGLNV
jgi:hypothetical protein